MPRPQFQDIVPPDRKSIKKIPIPERRRPQSTYTEPAPAPQQYYPRPSSALREQFADEPEPTETNFMPPPRPVAPRKAKSHKGWLIVTIVVILAIALFAGFALYPRVSGAIITITPKQQQVSVETQLKAVKEGVGDVHFQTVTLAKDGKLTIPASGEQYVESKASGTIIIYNKYSTATQKLVANTRFETSDGKIFRIADAVTVPGYTKSGTTITPGSIEAKVVADSVGPEYNIPLSDFTIPGFKGDPRFEGFYARSKTAMAGGFKGNQKKVDPASAATAREKIRAELKTALVAEVEKSIPAGYVMPNDAYVIEYTSQPDTTTTENSAQLSEHAIIKGLLFKRAELAQQIAIKTNTQPDSIGDISGINSLVFTTKNASTTLDVSADSITFNLKGSVGLISAVNTDGLKKELSGKPRKSLNAILANYPAISKAEVVMKPFWQKDFPTDPNLITVTVAPGTVSTGQ